MSSNWWLRFATTEVYGRPVHGRPLQGLHHHWGSPFLCFYILFHPLFLFFLVLVSGPCHAWKLNFVRVCGGGGGRASDLVLVDYEFILNCILGCGGCGVVWWWLLVVGSCVGVVNYVWWVVNIILMCYIYYFNI